MKVSDLARPPIQPQELAGTIEHWICPYHGGRIRTTYREDEVGKVYFCPTGRMYYRFTNKWQNGFDTPLPYDHERPV